MMTTDEARQAILGHHARLVSDVHARAATLAGVVAAGEPHEAARAELVAYLAGEVLPHAAAEEVTLYPAATTVADRVATMVAEHRRLEADIEALARATSGAAAAALGTAIDAAFRQHADVENEVVLPALLASPEIALPALLHRVHDSLEAAKAGTLTVARAGTDDLLAPVLVDSLVALAGAGRGQRACELAAAAWSRVRAGNPVVAARLTAALHRLVRLAGDAAAPDTATAAAADPDGDPELDVRELPPARRHQVIFTAYHALRPAAGFVLVNDHDPKPLAYQFAAEHTGEFTWDYLESGPRVWKVRIGKTTPAR